MKNDKNILENVHDVIYQLSPAGYIQYVSPKVKDIYGYSPKELIGKHFKKTTPLSEMPRALALFKRVLGGETVKGYELKQLDKNKKIVEMEVITTPLFEGKKVVGVQGVMRDITQRKQAEEALRKKEEQYRMLCGSMVEGMLYMNKWGRVVDVNDSISRMTGLSRQELVGKSIVQLAPKVKMEVPPILKAFRDRITGKGTGQQEVSFINRKGEYVTVLSTPSLVKKEGKIEGVVFVLEDISERKKTEEALRQAERELERAQRLASIQSLTAGVTHEIRNPLAVIRTESERLANAVRDLGELESFRKIILKEVDRIEGLIEKMLALTQQEPREIKDIDLRELVHQALRSFAFRKVTVKKELKRIPKIKGNPGEMREVLMALLRNAREAMPSGGTLTLRTYFRSKQVVVEVSDTGRGIPADIQEKIFDPFFSTRHEGVGLGLPIAYRIVREYGGELEVKSTPGKGATFTLTLPLKK